MNQFNGLNDAIKTIARKMKLPKIHVSDFAPQTFGDVLKSYSETKSIVVWSGGSDFTIYKDPQVNYLFRAMHDLTHVSLKSDFSLVGETRVAIYQMSQVGTELAKIIQIEVIGQAQHYFSTGAFPLDQVRFTLEQLKNQK